MAKQQPQPSKSYTIEGLQPAESMPIEFNNQVYDLAKLTDEQATYLLQFPDQVPFLKPLAQVAPIND